MTSAARVPLFFTLLGLWVTVAPAQDTADYFRQHCFSCHTIGGGALTGPDLKNVTGRQDREWLVRFILDPRAVIDSGDPYAQQLVREARGIIMPKVAGITPERASSLLDLIERESQLEESQFKGLQISDRPFTEEDIAQGRRLFTGGQGLVNDAPPCLSCHTMKGLGGLSGGRLGPDLTRVFERLGGRRNLGMWLANPPTPVMQPLFRDHPLQPEEITPLVALFEDAARQGGEEQSAAVLNFFLLGLGGTVILLFAFDAIWKGRFRSARAALVERRRAAFPHGSKTAR